MQWIYLSPHLDDAVLSCGGMIREQTWRGDQVGIWSLFAGDVPAGPLSDYARSLHARWMLARDAPAGRRAEEQAAARVLGATLRCFDYPDCIYRRLPDGSPVVGSDYDLFHAEPARETPLMLELSARLKDGFAAAGQPLQVVCPLTLGDHLDHRIVRAAAERTGVPLLYYADYPYAAQSAHDLHRHLPEGFQTLEQSISQVGLQAWGDSIAQHRSQISTFWKDEDDMRAAVAAYLAQGGGSRLYQAQAAGK